MCEFVLFPAFDFVFGFFIIQRVCFWLSIALGIDVGLARFLSDLGWTCMVLSYYGRRMVL